MEIENIHTQLQPRHRSIARAVRLGNAQTAVPRLLAMVCILAVFISSFFMQGAPGRCSCPCRWPSGSRWWPPTCCRARSSPCSPSGSCVTCISTIRGATPAGGPGWHRRRLAAELARRFPSTVSAAATSGCWRGSSASAGASSRRIWPCRRRSSGLVGSRLGTEIFPTIDTGQFRLRIRAPDGTDIDRTEQVALKALEVIQDDRGSGQRADEPGLPRHDSAPATRSMPCINGCGGRRTR